MISVGPPKGTIIERPQIQNKPNVNVQAYNKAQIIQGPKVQYCAYTQPTGI
jgi:hypothetical protein